MKRAASSSIQPVFLTGPTGSGKSALGVALAEQIHAEIISMDSMAVYRLMDIGTAKPTATDRQRVPHHIVDALDPWDEFSVAEYLRRAAAAVQAIVQRGRVPLFVGGTPLYLTSLLRGASSGPPPDGAIRARLEQQARELGTQSLHDRLRQVDPAAAKRIHPADLRRIVRALEVFQTTGAPISANQTHFHQPAATARRVICLERPRAELYARIDARVDEMFRQGLVDEVRALVQLPRPLSRTARQAVGYKEVLEFLDGARSLAESIELVKRRTRHFAKRQLTWFRRLTECIRVPADDAARPGVLHSIIRDTGDG